MKFTHQIRRHLVFPLPFDSFFSSMDCLLASASTTSGSLLPRSPHTDQTTGRSSNTKNTIVEVGEPESSARNRQVTEIGEKLSLSSGAFSTRKERKTCVSYTQIAYVRDWTGGKHTSQSSSPQPHPPQLCDQPTSPSPAACTGYTRPQ